MYYRVAHDENLTQYEIWPDIKRELIPNAMKFLNIIKNQPKGKPNVCQKTKQGKKALFSHMVSY